MTFYGYRRPDGRVGVRNKVLILPASVCASDVTRIIAQQVEGSVTFNNQQGCSQVAPDQQYTMDIMAGFASNPNIYGTVVVSLGCENCQMDLVTAAIRERTNKPLEEVIIQEVGGTLKAVETAVRYAKAMVADASILRKEDFPISELIVGTECGGSDPTSGLAANPVIGAMSDLLVAAGGTSILSETTEFIGAEHILARRAATPEVHNRIYEIVTRFEQSFHAVGEDVRAGNPSPGNKAGGITTLEEKSLGCIHKGGHSPVNAVYDYAKQVDPKQGLVIMDTPGNDPASVAAMVAGGAQVVVFSSGRGSPTGNPIAPVIKITGNKLTFAKMEDNIDFNAAPLIYGEKTVEALGEELLQMVVETACGKQTKAESLGFTEIAIARACNFV
ncbi:MAG: UxaA family hydrolase [Oscillibacter sp.]|nr:UxaA family hydrolase [Oscillibacter sp.]MEA4992382.1 UxaA family hydrolase [Oscillibacter sp.]